MQWGACALGGFTPKVLVQSLCERFGVALTTNDLVSTVSHVNAEGGGFGRGVGRLKFYERHHFTQLDRRAARLKNGLFVHRSVPFSARLKTAAKSHPRKLSGMAYFNRRAVWKGSCTHKSLGIPGCPRPPRTHNGEACDVCFAPIR